MVLLKKFSASRFGDQIREHNITIVTIPGALLKFILNTPDKPEENKNSLRAVFAGGNILTHEEYERFTRRFKVPLINWYGQTESVVCPLCLPLDGKRKEASIGLPALGYEVQIVDANDEEVSPGNTGEIAVRGLGKYSVMKEYYKDPGATAEALKNGWLHTGDLGYMDEEGYFYFAERKKEMIRVGGENVAAREVEMVLNQHPNIAESAVIGGMDKFGNEVIKAFIILREGKQATEQELKEYCSQKMAKFKIPGLFEFRTEFPRTAAGKIDKKTLRKLDGNSR
jgi:crotonobetaine/carnitine-CoA ligase